MKKIYLSILIGAAMLTVAPDANAQRWRVCNGGSCSIRSTARFRASYSNVYAGAVYSAPSPCEATCEEYDCETPQPCEPVLNSPVGSTYSPEPCAPVESCTEYAPMKTESGVVVKYSPACPTGSCPLRVSSLLSACNVARARYGVASLERDAELERGALAQARYCASVGSLFTAPAPPRFSLTTARTARTRSRNG